MISYSADDIRHRLPYRHPFLMVDRVDDIEPKVSGTGVKNIALADPVFGGHFPDKAIYPGVLLIESVAHVAGIVETAGEDEQSRGLTYLAGVRKFSFRKPVVPGDQCLIRVRRKSGLGALYEYDATITVDQRIVAVGSVAMAIQPPSDLT